MNRLKKMTESATVQAVSARKHCACLAGAAGSPSLRWRPNGCWFTAPRLHEQEPVDSGAMSVALFNHINSAVAGYGAVRGSPNKAAAAHKQQLEKLVSEADHILSKRCPHTLSPPSDNAATFPHECPLGRRPQCLA